MNIQRLMIGIASLSLMFSATKSPVWAQSQGESQLTSAQIKLLKSLEIKIAVPTYVPSGFRVLGVQTQLESEPLARYSIIYGRYDEIAKKQYCFAIEGSNGGVADLLEGKGRFPVNSSAFGQGMLYDGDYANYGKNPTLLSNWVGNDPFYRFAGSGTIAALSNCENISPSEAVRVSESLQYLR